MKDNRDFLNDLPDNIKALHKRKRILERTFNPTGAEWLQLSLDYEAMGYRANAAGCLLRAKEYGADVQIPEPEVLEQTEWWDK